jgi:O-antigen/teichoic acid export membrane protein
MIRATAVAALLRATSLALAMAASILLARLLGVQGLGLYAGAMAVAGRWSAARGPLEMLPPRAASLHGRRAAPQ